jgi:hypothetical protein
MCALNLSAHTRQAARSPVPLRVIESRDGLGLDAAVAAMAPDRP